MARKQAPKRSDSQWFELITECRTSGLSDAAWCQIKGIPSGTFYCAVNRLRDKSYAIPERSEVTDNTLDLTTKPDVVQIAIEPKTLDTPKPAFPQPVAASYLDNSHTLEIDMHGIGIRIKNDVDPHLLQMVLSSLGGGLC